MPTNPQQQLKRKADAPLKTTPKKQKKAAKRQASEEKFRKPSDWGQKDPIGITQAEIPLTNAEAFRLRGWYWRPRFDETEGGKYEEPECESPRGTKYW
jgi:hypothetical protein